MPKLTQDGMDDALSWVGIALNAVIIVVLVVSLFLGGERKPEKAIALIVLCGIESVGLYSMLNRRRYW